MRFPRIHPIRRARRNAIRSPTLTVATRGDFIKMRIEQLRQFRQLRGSFRTTEPIPVDDPYGNGASAYQRIARTTNGDIKTIVRAWDRAYRTYGLRNPRLGGTHNEAFERTHRRRWEHTRRRSRQLTRDRPDSDEFAENAKFWAIWLEDLAKYLNERQRGQPARMDIVADVLEQSISELPETLASAATTAAQNAANAARTTANKLNAAGTWLKWGALAGAGLLIVPPILRARKRNTTRPP
ncbi:MAG: hypothetical protein MJE77_17515 [Proteobacteria bacterium]|nr:hypothetical protein [Pseudomonadota bacterium]